MDSVFTTAPVFHPGELYVQKVAGTRGVADELGAFLATSIDTNSAAPRLFAALNCAWLSFILPHKTPAPSPSPYISVVPVFGNHGFISVVNATELTIQLDQAFCSTYKHLTNVLRRSAAGPGIPISFLAIDLGTRRRYRTNGFVIYFDSSANILRVNVKEAFPNCPKYINVRTLLPSTPPSCPNVYSDFSTSSTLTTEDTAIISKADTFFLGTHYAARGTDISHRGGHPGFVRVLSGSMLWWPDYRGNGMFQSNGNIHCDNRAGITILDFSTRKLLMLSGHTKIIWNPPAEYTVESASERIMQFHIENVQRSVGAVTDLRWKMQDISPYNPDLPNLPTGRDDTCVAKESLFPIRVRLVKIFTNSDSIKTFRFLSPKTVQFLPGQYATFEFDTVPTVGQSVVRTWTLSEVANSSKGDVTLEVSVKRKDGGVVSNWLHDCAKPGLSLLVRGIGGNMTPFSENSEFPRKLLLVSAGVGITPNMAILRGLGAQLDRNSDAVDVVMIHQDRRMNSVPFLSEIDRRAGGSHVLVTMFLTAADEDVHQVKNVSVKKGRMGERELLEEGVVSLMERTVFLCGPPGFMQSVSRALAKHGVSADRIITEKFDF